MAESPVKEEQQDASGEISGDVIKQDYNPHKQSTCASFLRAYRPFFIKNFNKVCKEKCTCGLCLNELDIEDNYLYDVMFNPDVDVREDEVNSLFKKLILHSSHVDVVLNQSWLMMIDDYISGLRRLKGRVDEITSLTTLLHNLFRMLDEAYFEISKQVNITAPQVDKSSDPYKKIIARYKMYVEAGPENDEEFSGLKIHSFYHSTPLNMKATVQKIEEDSVTFNVHPYVTIALRKVAVAFISSPVHDDVHKAYADKIDVENRKVRFTSFISHDHDSENRSHVRVEISQMTRAMIIGNQAEAEGIIYDISEVACAIYVRNITINNFETGSPVRFMATLPGTSGGDAAEIDTMAIIYQSYKQGENDLRAYRIVIRYDNEPAFFAGLANYVSSRQREIIRELKDLSDVTLDAEITEDVSDEMEKGA